MSCQFSHEAPIVHPVSNSKMRLQNDATFAYLLYEIRTDDNNLSKSRPKVNQHCSNDPLALAGLLLWCDGNKQSLKIFSAHPQTFVPHLKVGCKKKEKERNVQTYWLNRILVLIKIWIFSVSGYVE